MAGFGYLGSSQGAHHRTSHSPSAEVGGFEQRSARTRWRLSVVCRTCGFDPILYVKDNLSDDLKVYVEYSNEVWNYLFSQTEYAEQIGLALGLDQNGFTAALRYYSQRAVEIFKIWEEVFGGKERLVRILASQAVNPWTGEQVLSWNSAYEYADAYAIAPYLDGDDLSNPNNVDTTLQMTANQIIDNILLEIRTEFEQYITTTYNLTHRYGLKLFAYEGGLHLVSSGMPADKEPQVTTLFQAVNRNPWMKEVYLEYLNMWKKNGGELFNQFVDVSPFTKYGSWGALEYQNQDLSTAPKYLGLMEFIAQNQAVLVNSSRLRKVPDQSLYSLKHFFSCLKQKLS